MLTIGIANIPESSNETMNDDYGSATQKSISLGGGVNQGRRKTKVIA